MGKKKKRKKGKELAQKNSLLTCRIVFIGLVLIFTLVFFRTLYSLEEFGYSRTLQVLIYIGLIGIFSYLCWESFSKEWNKKRVLIVSIIGFILLIGIYILAFDPLLDTGGDNAFYIIGAKSFASFQGYRFLNEPNAPPNTWGAPSLPFLLAPIVRFAGIKIIALKTVPFCLAMLFVILTFLFFKNYLPLPVALIITLLIATNANIIHFSSLILTETSFLFFSMLALFLLDKFDKERKPVSKYLFLSGFFVIVTYWTRLIGLGFLATSVLYFVFRKHYKKAFTLGAVVLILFLSWQIRCIIVQTPGTLSPISFLSSKPGEPSLIVKTINSGISNLKIAINIVPQNIFNNKIAAGRILKINFWIVIVFIFIVAGYLRHLIRRRTQMDLYFLGTPVFILGARDWGHLELSRYFVVLIPFLIYYFFNGLNLAINQLCKKLKISENASHTVVLATLSSMFFLNLLGANDRIQHAHRSEPYPPGYTRFLETAFWAKENTPKDAYFGVRKSRTFYLFSERYTTGYLAEGVSRYGSWSKEAERKTLEMYKEKGIDYIILDRFSRSAHQLIYPIVRNNPEKFKVVYVTEKPKTFVLKVKRDSFK